jgi:frataxin
MDEGDTQFETLAERALQAMAEAIEASGADVEVDFIGGILTVELADGRQFVVNKHAGMRQIWLSSPISGARHYRPDKARWTDTRDGSDLGARLGEELTAATGTPVRLP